MMKVRRISGLLGDWLFEKEEWDENQRPESGTHVWIRQSAIE